MMMKKNLVALKTKNSKSIIATDGKHVERNLASVLMTMLMVLVLSLWMAMPKVFAADATPISGNYTITQAGTYEIVGNSVVTVNTQDAVTLQGNGSSYAVTVNCNVKANLTINNLSVNAPSTDANIINFTTGNNTLTLQGESLLENDKTTKFKAAIRVPSGVSLDVQGSGTLYMYKNTMGAGIGGDYDENSGAITFNHKGNIFIKGTMTGAVIGGNQKANGSTSVVMGDITINSGCLNLETNARGAAIGGGANSNGGNVYLKGGNVKIACGGTGYAIGSGSNGLNGGTLTITGGSLYVTKASSDVLSPELINATITNGTTTNLACLKLPISDTFKDDEFTVTVDGAATPFYTGKVNLWQYVGSETSTKANWTEAGESAVYLWLPTTRSIQATTIAIKNDSGAVESYQARYVNSAWTLTKVG